MLLQTKKQFGVTLQFVFAASALTHELWLSHFNQTFEL